MSGMSIGGMPEIVEFWSSSTSTTESYSRRICIASARRGKDGAIALSIQFAFGKVDRVSYSSKAAGRE